MEKVQKTKTLTTRNNGRSSDAVSPNFILGCKQGKNSEKEAFCKYCYVSRYPRDMVYINQNTTDILNSINTWVKDKPFPKIKNQCHHEYYVIDIGCSTDVLRYWKKYNWLRVFEWFKQHPKLMATFATKFTNNLLYTYNPEKKIRIRPSLMPQKYSTELELKTASIKNRLEAANKLFDCGYEVHFNLSPVIVHGKEWREEYQRLFELANQIVRPDVLKDAQLEVIFMTYNPKHHLFNQANGFDDRLLWKPEWQEHKKSQYGGPNLRYKHVYKADMIRVFKGILKDHFDLPIRYIF